MAEALKLADVCDGVGVIDLGCGDGSVLLVAAQMGAVVTGIEADEDLADEAAQNLFDAGIDAEILNGDLFDPTIEWDADVFFAYLAPATLQRLLPRLRTEAPARLVTVDFDVPGLVPNRRGDSARLYRLPGRRRRVGDPGWEHEGTLVATVPDVQSLTCLEVVHPSGDTGVVGDWSHPEFATIATGADRLSETGTLAVDLRWEEPPEGQIVSGVIRTAAAGDHHVFMVATDHEEEAQWDLSDVGVAGLRAALDSATPPTTVAAALAAATH